MYDTLIDKDTLPDNVKFTVYNSALDLSYNLDLITYVLESFDVPTSNLLPHPPLPPEYRRIDTPVPTDELYFLAIRWTHIQRTLFSEDIPRLCYKNPVLKNCFNRGLSILNTHPHTVAWLDALTGQLTLGHRWDSNQTYRLKVEVK